MKTGIYLLSFPNTNQVYIGQSVDIEKRFSQHKNAMLKNKSVPKLQKAYDTYGMPRCVILAIGLAEELNTWEAYYIKQFDSITNGFNTISPPQIHQKEITWGDALMRILLQHIH